MDILGVLGPTPDDIMFHVIPGTGKPNTMATLNEASTESREGVPILHVHGQFKPVSFQEWILIGFEKTGRN